MPRFFVDGTLCIGLGRDPYDATRSIAQECNTLRPGCVIALSDGTIPDPPFDSTHSVGSGHGHWAAVVYPSGDYRDSSGRHVVNDTGTPWWRLPAAIGPDGAVCLRPHSNAFAEFVDVKGEVFLRVDEDVSDVQLLGGGKLLYRRKNGALVTRGFTLANLPDAEWGWPRAVWFVDRYALLYQSYSGGALVFDGRIVARGVSFYRPDAIVFDNALHVAYSTQPQELGVTPKPIVVPLPSFDALPRLVLAAPPAPRPPAPVPVPVPVPQPAPKDDTVSQKIVEDVRAKYPRRNPGGAPIPVEEAWMPVVEIAQLTGTLVFRKDAGDDSSHTFIPAGLLRAYPNGVWISRTIVGKGALGNTWRKVFGDGEGAASPIWRLGDTPADGEYIDVREIALSANPHPLPPDEKPQEPPAGDLTARVAALEAFVARLQAAVR